ncbi:hypothetical protein O6P43_033664 [Quillaja saponaria]|uniref:Uncharacterized protein n=1 Tax=Quillaja saponaria TaxID=32244 RepID=A0AAD7KR41_QUISA|nr:hypothetical protein O6P43_033664 [Quillaja saponaria]
MINKMSKARKCELLQSRLAFSDGSQLSFLIILNPMLYNWVLMMDEFYELLFKCVVSPSPHVDPGVCSLLQTVSLRIMPKRKTRHGIRMLLLSMLFDWDAIT